MAPDTGQWILLAVGTLLIGMNKAGLRGLNVVVVPMFVAVLGGRTSVAVVLPLLITGDICAIIIYRKSVAFRPLLRLLPATLLGLAAAMFLGSQIPDNVFRITMGAILVVCLGLMAYKEFGKNDFVLPDHWAAHGIAGLLGGFSTMIGNAAGPIMAIYMMAMNLEKRVFIGTGAVFFFVVNLLKVPIHLAYWESMDRTTFGVSIRLAPLVLLGMFGGYLIVNRIPERPFRLFILVATLVGTLTLFI